MGDGFLCRCVGGRCGGVCAGSRSGGGCLCRHVGGSAHLGPLLGPSLQGPCVLWEKSFVSGLIGLFVAGAGWAPDHDSEASQGVDVNSGGPTPGHEELTFSSPVDLCLNGHTAVAWARICVTVPSQLRHLCPCPHTGGHCCEKASGSDLSAPFLL